MSSAATITMRMGFAAVGCAPPGGRVTDSTFITEYGEKLRGEGVSNTGNEA